MTLPKESLQWISEHSAATAIELREAIDAALTQPAIGQIPFVAVTDGAEFKSLEQFLPSPVRFRGTFTTSDLLAYSKYCTENDTEISTFDAVTYVDGDKISAITYFDLGKANKNFGFGEHKAQLSLIKTPEYSALLDINTRFQSQQDLAEWLETYRHLLTPVSDFELTPYAKGTNNSIAAVRTIDITKTHAAASSVGDFKAERSDLEKIEAKSALELPWGYKFTARPYDDLQERVFVLRLALRTGSSQPTLSLSVVGLTLIQNEIAREFAARIKHELGGMHSVYVGRFSK